MSNYGGSRIIHDFMVELIETLSDRLTRTERRLDSLNADIDNAERSILILESLMSGACAQLNADKLVPNTSV